MDKKLIIGTRGSALALWQANYIKDKLANIGVIAELKIIKTQGDIIQNLRLDKLEGKGFFTKELEIELLSDQIDLAVHSHKDLPTTNPPGLQIAAVSERENPAELLIIKKERMETTNKLSLRNKARIGTSSNRRKAQLLSFRPDLDFEDLRGNIQTRIQKLRDNNMDAIVLAKAGVSRVELDLSEFHIEEIPPTKLIPAPAQGVLAIQIKEDNTALYDILQKIHHPEVAELIDVERKVLNLSDAGCHAPLGCYCRRHNGKIQTWASVAKDNDDFPDRLYVESDTTDGLADFIFRKFQPKPTLHNSVFISRALEDNSYLRRFFNKHNVEVDSRSLIRIFPIISKLDSFILKHADWIFFGSKNAIKHFFSLEPRLMKKTKIAVLGQGSEQALRRYGRVADLSGDQLGLTVNEFAEKFAEIAKGAKVVIPCAKEGVKTIQNAMTPDTNVVSIPIYQTVLKHQVDKTNADVLIFTSPSNVESYFRENLLNPDQKIISIGTSTGAKLDEMNVPYILPFSPDELGLAEAYYSLQVKKD